LKFVNIIITENDKQIIKKKIIYYANHDIIVRVINKYCLRY